MDATHIQVEAGQLRHSIQVQQQSTEVDYSGQPLQTWTKFVDLKASIEPLQGEEGARERQMHAEATHRVITHHVAGIDTGMRILFGTRIFNILFMANVLERTRKLVFTCREIVG